MTFSLLSKFALKNIKNNRQLIIPFVFSTIFMLMLFFVALSLETNEYVIKRHEYLIILIRILSTIIAIFTAIFMLYSNSVLYKQRYKEFALYSILGLDKKHVVLMVWIEQAILFVFTCLFSIFGGFLLGKLLFVGLTRLLGDYVFGAVTKYDFDFTASIKLIIFLLVVYTILFVVNLIKISVTTPISLLNSGKKYESEPKVKILSFILGILFLFIGYFIALMTSPSFASLYIFFIASILVIAATYLLFINCTIFILKMLRKNKKFYYKPKHFLSVSSMLYRMKTNATGLASICVFATGIILSLATTMTVYDGMNSVLENSALRDYSCNGIARGSGDSVDAINADKAKILDKVYATVEDKNKIKNAVVTKNNIYVPAVIDDNGISKFKNDLSILTSNQIFLTVYLIDDYKELFKEKIPAGADINLADNEIMVVNHEKSKISVLETDTSKYKVKTNENKLPSDGSSSIHLLLVPNNDVYKDIVSYLGDGNNITNYNVYWDVENPPEDYKAKAEKILQITVATKEEFSKRIYGINGGFLLLGGIFAVIFLVGTILITYYKRISEAYEDRGKYQIMYKAGLEDKILKQVSNIQFIWMFFLPIGVAVVHCLAASSVIYGFSTYLGQVSYSGLLINIGIVICIFFVIYVFVYLLLSRIIYRIIR